MRQILIDRARRSNALKRGGGATRSLIDMHSIAGSDEPGLDALRLSELMERLRSKDERAAQAVELRAFGGLSTYHISELLSLSQRTVRDDLSRASGFITQWASES
jgi:DNA-directed RNA polymerase specialized sigma24 family protein